MSGSIKKFFVGPNITRINKCRFPITQRNRA